MTISSTNRLAGPYIGDGTTAIFPFTFKTFAKDDLLVMTLASSGAIAVLTLDADYSAVLNGNQDTNPGGSITLLAGNLAVGLQLIISTDMAELQSVNLTNGGGFYPDVINTVLDTLVILVQQLQLQASRAIQAELPDTVDMTLPGPAVRAGKVIMFDAAGNLQLVTLASGSSSVVGGQVAAGTVDGANKDFTFTASAAVTPTPIVFAGGVYQSPVGGSPDYGTPVHVSGTTWKITFTTAPTNGPISILMFA